MSLLSIVQEAAVMCNLPQPTAVINSTDPNVPLLLALANKEGQELSRRHDWSILTYFDFTFTSVATEEQTGFSVNGDFDRLLPNPELWNRSLTQKYTGPLSAREWSQLETLAVTSASPGWWRLFPGTTAPYTPTVYIFPAPTAGETLAMSYVSKGWTSAFLDKWASDTDTGAISERLMTLGLIWRYKKSKGLDYAEDMASYEREVERACSRDRGVGVLRLRRERIDDFPSNPTWPGQVIP